MISGASIGHRQATSIGCQQVYSRYGIINVSSNGLSGGHMLKRVRFLTGQSIVYGLGTVLMQGLGFLLIPLYTQYLAPDSYGVLSVTGAVISILLSLIALGLPAAAVRFFFDARGDQEGRTIVGTIWITSVVAAAGFTAAFLVIGPVVSPWLFPDVPFFPYLLLALFIACFQVLRLLPLAVFRAQEKARRFVAFSVGTFLLTVLLSILFVAVMRLDVTGALLARFFAYGIGAAAAVGVLLRYAKLRFRPDVAKRALLFGVPLVPTGMAGWLLRLSDRVIMQRYVSLTDIGIYTLGYQIGESISMLGTAINSAWAPFYYRTFQEHGTDAPAILAPLITYIILVATAVALAVSVYAPEIVRLLARPDYHDAHLVIPWIALSSVIQVFNWIARQGLMYAKKTYWDPLIYFFGGIVNLGLNLLLLPRVGYMAAAWTTLIGFIVMGSAMYVISQRVHPMIYEYRRLAILIVTAAVVFFVSHPLSFSTVWLSIVGKTALLGLYPLLLWLLGFVTDRERKALGAIYTRTKHRFFAHP